MAFTAKPDLRMSPECNRGISAKKRSLRGHGGWYLDKGQEHDKHRKVRSEGPTHRKATSSLQAARARLVARRLRWSGPVLTNYGFMAVRKGNKVTIHVGGNYLLCMRPDQRNEKRVVFVLRINRRTTLWKVWAEGIPVGDMAAFHFAANTTLKFFSVHSEVCDLDLDSIISIALCQADEG